jgi:uncharacterized protein (DUF1778 family)
MRAAELLVQTGVKNNRTERINTRLTLHQVKSLDRAAEAAGCSRAGLTAALVLDGLERLAA